ncbi:MAG: glycosyltransferase, partial [Cyclobacteriaceae bacterium]|nr:glycosyltransferase [Cyclobacteriaceae bacterium]
QIILDYQKKYPDLIKPIFQEKNLWSQGTRALSATYNFPRAQGKYIAICEGDDFWTDPYKLQKQVDFLENNPDYVACVHGAHFFDESLNSIILTKFNKVQKDFDLNLFKILNELGNVYPSCSILMRNTPPFYPNDLLIFPSGDLTLIIFLKLKGKIRFMKGLWATYRIHPNGVYQGEKHGIKNIIKNRYLIQEYFSKLSKKLPKSSTRGLLFLFKVKNYLSIIYLKMKILVKPT